MSNLDGEEETSVGRTISLPEPLALRTKQDYYLVFKVRCLSNHVRKTRCNMCCLAPEREVQIRSWRERPGDDNRISLQIRTEID